MRKIYSVILASVLLLTLVTGCGPITEVKVNPNYVTLQPGDTRQFEAYAYDRTGNPHVGEPLAWTTSDPLVASVDACGLVRALAPGHATITATFRGKIPGNAAVVVCAVPPAMPPAVSNFPAVCPPNPSPAVATVIIMPTTLGLPVGASQCLTAIARDAMGRVVRSAEFNWASSDPRIASVTMNGVVVAHCQGTVTISAAEGTRIGTATVAVGGAVSLRTEPPAPAPIVGAAPTGGAPPAGAKWTYVSGPQEGRVKSVIDSRCATCHRPGGLRSTPSLTSYPEVKAVVDSGDLIRSLNGSMGPYAGPDRDRLIAWAQSGAAQ